jgi:hypothetical protein
VKVLVLALKEHAQFILTYREKAIISN